MERLNHSNAKLRATVNHVVACLFGMERFTAQVPANPAEDADLILQAAIEELIERREREAALEAHVAEQDEAIRFWKDASAKHQEQTDETQESITQWARETFGEPSDIFQIWERVYEELAELNHVITEGLSVEKIASECANVEIVLRQIPEHLGFDLQEAVNRKMAINRKRKWQTNGDGTGQHIEE